MYQAIVIPKGGRYNNRKSSGLIMNASIDEKDFAFTNRISEVVNTPLLEVPFDIGDELIVHHNVFRKYWGFNTHLRTSSNDLNNGTFQVSLDSMFAYRKPKGDWIMLDDWIFVEPIEKPKTKIIYDFEHEVKQQGLLAHGEVDNVSIGDRIGFKPNSEYIFEIEGKKYFKMRNRDITCKIL